jgi:hypothetical protein
MSVKASPGRACARPEASEASSGWELVDDLGGWDDRDGMLNYLLSLRLRAPESDDTPRDDSIRWIAGFRERLIVRVSGQCEAHDMAGNAGSAYHSDSDNDNMAARLLWVTSINYTLWITS